MNVTRLTDVLEEMDSGSRPKGGVSASGEILSIGAEHLSGDGGFSLQSPKRISKDFYEDMRKGHIAPGNILIVKDGATTGKTSLVREDSFDGSAAVNEHVFRLVVDSGKTYSPYVFHYLRTQKGQTQILSRFHGAAQGGITKEFTDSVRFPLPPLSEQKRIAAILDKADELRRKRRAAIAKLDTLIQSIFLDMFGDPVTNPKGWEQVALPRLVDVITDGPFGSNLKTEHYTNDGIRVVRLQNIGVGRFIDTDKAFVAESHFQALPRNHCFPGDVIAATLGDPNLRACILPEYVPRALNKADCVLLRSRRGIASEYLCWLLNQPGTLHLASGMFHGETRSRISMGQLRQLVLPCPPAGLQEEFTRRLTKVSNQEVKYKTSDSMFKKALASLQQQVFSGVTG